MPRIPRPCLTCGQPTTNGSRCKAHTPTWEQRRGTDRNTWQRTRAYILERDDYQCTNCGSTHRLEVHHITPIAAGGRDQPVNLTTLCHDCHTRIS